jgi:ATP-dependent RNA helicase DeaD
MTSDSVIQETTTSTETSTAAGFSTLGLSPAILNALSKTGYEAPSPIQRESIPLLLSGRDILATAQTGTGKTAAFALPILSQLTPNKKTPQAIVLVPTRELAIQVAEAFQTYAQAMKGVKVLPIYGGQDMVAQLKQLKRGVDVVVGTPGRVMDHLRRGTLDLDDLETVVLDEADEMLRMGFIDDVSWILEHTPPTRQVALFSATMPEPIRKVAQQHLTDPAQVRIAREQKSVSSIDQQYWLVSGTHKLDALSRFLEIETVDGAIIFVRTKTLTVELTEKLEARGHATAAINGDMNQALRERTIEQLKSGKINIVIATDVAARGIDVSRISHVFNYDIPYDAESYVHRIGRTGRAGRSGKALLFVAPRERRLLRSLERATGRPIEQVSLPSPDAVNAHRLAKYKSEIEAAMDLPVDPFFQSLVESILTERDADPTALATALAWFAQKDNPVRLPMQQKSRKERQRDSRVEASDGRSRGRNSAPRDDDGELVSMERYRIAVGRAHQVRPGDIVGAIANEADIDSQFIGQIILHDQFSTVDLPEGMPKEVFQHLKHVHVRNQKLQIERDRGGHSSARAGRPRRNSFDGKKEGGPRSGDRKSFSRAAGPKVTVRPATRKAKA